MNSHRTRTAQESLIKVLNRNPIDAALDADILAIVLNGRARLV
jgi:hypothetical protein